MSAGKKPPQSGPKYPVFQANFRRMRDAIGIRHDDIARRLDVASATVESWSKGRSMPDGENIVELAELFGCHPRDLIKPQRPTRGDSPPSQRGR